MMYNIMLYYLSLSCICAVVSLSYLNPESAVIEERLINPFANATSVFCGSKVDTFQAIIGARIRLHCGLAGSTTTVESPTCVRGVIEALHSCSGLSRSDMEQCLTTAVVHLDGDVCGLPTHTPYGPIRTTLCNTMFHLEDTMKSSVRTFCIADEMAREGRNGCGFWKWTECAGEVAAASISCCASESCLDIPCLIEACGHVSTCIDCIQSL